jgi:hypothetical protein
MVVIQGAFLYLGYMKVLQLFMSSLRAPILPVLSLLMHLVYGYTCLYSLFSSGSYQGSP